MAQHRCCATSRCSRKIRRILSAWSICVFMPYVFLFPPSAEAGLYTPTDQIVILNPDTVDSVLFNSSSALVVEFYASWCGHCIAFSPVWKSLARDVKEWKPAVDLAAIDCADEVNRMTCFRFGITGYPTLKFFHAYSRSESQGQRLKAPPYDVRGLRHLVIDTMETHEETWPPACPPLEPASKAEIDNFFETNSGGYLALVFEEAGSYVGREVTLDLLQYENITVRRVLSTEDGLVSKLGVTEFPSCYLYRPGGNFTRLGVDIEARTFYSYALQRLPGVIRAGKSLTVVSDLHENTTQQEWRPFNRTRVYMSDLESALHYSLRVELAAHPVISGEDLTALKRYVSVLAKYFPGRPMVQNLLQSVDAWLKERGDSELLYSSLQDMLDNTGQIPDAVLPEGVKWVGCQGTQAHFRGYPCSVWTLFHVLTVQAMKTPGAAPLEVLQALRGYVHSFFGCRYCASHFETMARENMNQVRSPATAALWLWYRHNRVNNRLAGALSEDPSFPKVQWPPPDLCPRCHTVKRNGEHSWNQEEVLRFLKEYFSSERLLQDYLEGEAQLLREQREKLAARREQEAQRGADGKGEGGGGGGRAEEGREGEEEEEEEAEEQGAAPAPGEMAGLRPADEPWASELPPWGWPTPGSEPAEAAAARRRAQKPSIVGLKPRQPREDIVDLDSFVNQHYKAKALRAAALAGRVRRRSLQRKEEAEPQPVEPERPQERGLPGRYAGLEEERGDGGPGRKRWTSLLSVGFSGLDLSLCLLLYFSSCMCLLAMYLYFRLRLRLRRAKVAQP
ncbi:sulfhydryl oxidase 1 [Anguilla anguilla]|uniref:sulfhydryl oxidase 1 n=1 Tax=Anguilla anguilla TaxID=7936 RepID=UPI0015A9470B|nr:sulfhydryl oxidase 1 [Anguilla anguilla]